MKLNRHNFYRSEELMPFAAVVVDSDAAADLRFVTIDDPEDCLKRMYPHITWVQTAKVAPDCTIFFDGDGIPKALAKNSVATTALGYPFSLTGPVLVTGGITAEGTPEDIPPSVTTHIVNAHKTPQRGEEAPPLLPKLDFD